MSNLLLTDQSSEVRLQCVQTLKQFGKRQAIPASIAALNDSVRDIQIMSALALAELGEEEKCMEFATNLWNKGDNDNLWWYCQSPIRKAR